MQVLEPLQQICQDMALLQPGQNPGCVFKSKCKCCSSKADMELALTVQSQLLLHLPRRRRALSSAPRVETHLLHVEVQ